MAISKVILSGSVNGRPILITTDESPGVVLHTASNTELDEIWIYLHNSHIASVTVTLQWGSTTSEGNIVQTVPNQAGLYLAVPGLVLTNGQVVRAYAQVVDVVTALGFVNRIASL